MAERGRMGEHAAETAGAGVKSATDSAAYLALRRFEARHPGGIVRYITKGRIFGISIGMRWRSICEKFLR
jgi:hypothetical protein